VWENIIKESRGNERKTFNKKNYIDPTAAFLYSLGCSLVHLALFITIFFVEMPNVDRAKEFDSKYAEQAGAKE